MKEYERIVHYANLIAQQIDFKVDIAIVLGSGLNDYANTIEVIKTIEYKSLEGFPTCHAQGHVGRFVFGKIASKYVALMQGRVHLYEGYDPNTVVLPLRVLHLLGAQKVIFSNAAGSMRKQMAPNDFMIWTDQISFLIPSVLAGENIDELGDRFIDTTDMFSPRLREIGLRIAKENGIRLHQGVYIQAYGPHFETVAEMKAFVTFGADAVGMSTAIEALAAWHMKMEICAISCITNYESGLQMSNEPLTHQAVQQMALQANHNFKILVDGIVKEM